MKKALSHISNGIAGPRCAAAQRGQSLVELVIALAVFSIVISAGVSLFFGGQMTLVNSGQAQSALRMAHDGLDGTRSIWSQDWMQLTNGDHGLQFSNGTWQFSGTSDTKDEFTRHITISTVSDVIKKIYSTVTWQGSVGDTKQIQLVETMSNWAAADTIFGDWTHPRIIGGGDIGSGTVASDIAYQSGHVYIAGTSSNVAKPDFFVFNVADPTAPVLKGSLNFTKGLAAVSVLGNYAYVVDEANPIVYVLDVSNENTPVKVAQLTVTGGKGLSVFAKGNYVYVGTDGTNQNFSVVDITNPLAPIQRSYLSLSGSVNDISVKGTTAYCATTDKDGELTLVNVSNPNSPSLVSKFDALGDSELGKAVFAKTIDRVYLGRLVGGNHSQHHEYYIVNAQNQNAPVEVGSLDIASSINDLRSASYLTFLATSDTNKEFQVMNNTNPAAIVLYGSLNLPNIATGMAYNMNIVYVAMRSNDALKIITSTY